MQAGGLAKKFKNLIKRADMYGAPIGLRYKSKNSYQTFTGGTFTIISRILIICFLGYGLMDVYHKKNAITKKTLYKDMFIDKQKLHLTQDNFDVGVSLSFTDDVGDANDNIFRYMEFQFLDALVTYDEQSNIILNYTYQNFSKCGSERFGGDAKVMKEMGLNNYYCDANLNTKIYGSQTGESNQYVIFIRPCKNKTLNESGVDYTCAPQDAIDHVFDASIATLVVMSSYFDAYEFENDPIKKQYRTYLYSLGHGVSTGQDIYVQENEVYTYDSWIGSFFGGDKHTYLDTYLGKYYTGAAKQDIFPELSVYFMISSFKDSTTRQVRSLMDCLIETGGLSNVILLLAKLSILKLQEQLFYQSLIKKMFKVQRSNFNERKLSQTYDFEKTLSLTADNIKQVQEYLFKSIPFRISPDINILKHKLMRMLCMQPCRKKEKSKDQIIFDNAVSMLDRQFDIVKTLQSVRSSLLLQKIFLTKSQRKLIPFFKDNLISCVKNQNQELLEKKTTKENIGDLENSKSDKMEKIIRKIILNSKTSKLNYKILKELIHGDEESNEYLSQSLKLYSRQQLYYKEMYDQPSPFINDGGSSKEIIQKNLSCSIQQSDTEFGRANTNKQSKIHKLGQHPAPSFIFSQDTIQKKRKEQKLVDAFGSFKVQKKSLFQKKFKEKI